MERRQQSQETYWKAEKEDEETNSEEIQFQTLQFNQHYSSPGSSNCKKALKTHKNITKIILRTPKVRID